LETEKNGYFGVEGNFDKFEWMCCESLLDMQLEKKNKKVR
jgi:hypothetical protein